LVARWPGDLEMRVVAKGHATQRLNRKILFTNYWVSIIITVKRYLQTYQDS